MRIDRIKIDRYGILENIDLELKPGLQAIYGDNETGKTLILDFLIKKFAGKDIYYDTTIHRVDEEPEGFITINNDKKRKLERDEILQDFIQISPDEIRNIFLIRDSDLKFLKERNFFESITNRLTGISTADLAKISEKVHEIGRITIKKKELANDAKHNRIKTKIEIAKNLRNKVIDYQVLVSNNGLNELEGSLYDKEDELTKTQNTISNLKKAKEKKEFDKMDAIIEKSKEQVIKIKNLPEKEKLDKISIKIDVLNEMSPKRERFHTMLNYSKWSLCPYIAFASLLWNLWFFLNVPKLGLATPVILSVFSIISLILWLYAYFRLNEHKDKETEIFNDAKKIGLNYKSINNLKKNLSELKTEFNENETNLIQNIGILGNYFNIQSKNKEEVLSISISLLEEKKPLINLDIKIEYTDDKLTKYEEKSKRIRNEIENLKEELRNHQKTLQEFSSEANNLNFDFFLNEELGIEIENLDSLELLLPKLQKYIDAVEKNAENCRLALSIFDEIKLEEKSKITELFNKKKQTAKIFSEFTKGKYVNVRYDHLEEEIFVENKKGKSIIAKNLSKGTLDQLYLAIKLDFAQRILKKKKGFFVMDDAFLAADHKRFEDGIKTLKILADIGWQIIYFTAKINDSNLIENMTGNKTIILPPLA